MVTVNRRIFYLTIIATWFVLVSSQMGCKKVSIEEECADDGDCGENERCLSGVCVSSTDGDVDSDADSDSDSDADGDSDADCDSAVEGASEWGEPCEFNKDCEEDGVVCLHLTIEDGAEEGGYCTPVCCDLFKEDEDFCTNVAEGQEMCLIFNGEVNDPTKRWCAVTCENNKDCPEGNVCLGYDNPLQKGICYPPR